jgi:rare lipoprotein A
MQAVARPRLRRTITLVSFAACAALLAGCGTPQPKTGVKQARSKEYFPESKYGVKASPRVAFGRDGIRRGGGRDQLGKPYQVAGKWYYPKEDRKYSKVGAASWYGDAFHGRLTANGEVYDTAHLTAAHPTMPLPSYARVTNMANGSSVIVRVNDRGPYHGNRIIDLSKRAAEMLDYASIGTAKVKVDYIGRAPLDGDDDQYLLASYNPGNKPHDPSVGLPTGVMIAMNGSTPSAALAGASAIPFPGQLTDSAPAPQPVMTAQAPAFGYVVLPDFGPIVPQRPDIGQPQQLPFPVASLSYADERIERAAGAFAALDKAGMTPADVEASWKRLNASRPGAAASSRDYVAAGSFETDRQARAVAGQLEAYGRVEIQTAELDGRQWHTVNLYANGRASLDEMLEAAWSHGAPDALAVRD